MIYLLSGPDTYRSRMTLRGIVGEFRKKAGGAAAFVKRVDAEEENIEVVGYESRTPSFLAPRRLFIIERISGAGEKQFSLVRPLLKEWAASKDCTFVFWDPVMVEESEILSTVRESAVKTQEFRLLSGVKLASWFEKELLRRGATLRSEAKRLLLDSSGGDLWKLTSELSKVEAGFLFENGEGLREAKIWDFTDSFVGKRGRSLGAALRLLFAGEHELYLLGALAKTLRSLISFRAAIEKNTAPSAVGRALGLHEFVAKKTYQTAAGLSLKKIIFDYRRLLRVDENIKTGRLSGPVAFLELFVGGRQTG
ncbi:MAG: hypothetical protein HYW90_02120 [Candidatus Sungbacteria bacterium]|nr:hypothetical protein [Candidatus Sungbacteria bacterium]